MKEEDLKYIELYDKVLKLAKENPDYVKTHDILHKREETLRDIAKTMTKEQRQAVFDYLASLCADNMDMVIVAYELGRQHGPRKEHETLVDWVEDPERWMPLLVDDPIYPTP